MYMVSFFHLLLHFKFQICLTAKGTEYNFKKKYNEKGERKKVERLILSLY